MTHWLYLPQLESTGDTAVLEDSEAVHAVRARRLRVGDRVSVFDGVGRTAVARISDVIKRPLAVHLAVGAHQHWVPPAVRIHLTSALPKGDRQVTMLDMATQLGPSAAARTRRRSGARSSSAEAATLLLPDGD